MLKRVFDIDMQHDSDCGGGQIEIIAAILKRPEIEKILSHLGIDPQPPPKGRAREAGRDFAAWAALAGYIARIHRQGAALPHCSPVALRDKLVRRWRTQGHPSG